MKYLHQALMASSFFVITACGSSDKQAPVVYGADGSREARIYNSPQELYRSQQAARNPYTQQNPYARNPYETRVASNQQTRPAPVTKVEPVALEPVSAVYQPQPVRYETKTTTRRTSGYVEVQPGDTVYAIGRRYQVDPKQIIAINRLSPPYALSIGQALKLPGGAAITVPAAPATRQVVAQDMMYTVKPGDTLYAISRATKVPVQNIAAANSLSYPYNIGVGQRLLVPQARTSGMVASTTPAPAPTIDRAPAEPRNVADIARTASYTPPAAPEPVRFFDWPVKGAVISEYGAGALGRRNEGVNIAAPAGTPVRAAADGEIVYRGSELDGYGNLLLVKHEGGYVTAYAHNDAMLVRKGQKVRKGQVIAKVGDTGAVSTPQLHFEIRRNLKSVDPKEYLGPQ